MTKARHLDRLHAGMAEIERAIAEGTALDGLRLHASDFKWNSGQPLDGGLDKITLRVARGPYRSFEETFSPEQLELGLKDPTVQVFVGAAVIRLTRGLARVLSAHESSGTG